MKGRRRFLIFALLIFSILASPTLSDGLIHFTLIIDYGGAPRLKIGKLIVRSVTYNLSAPAGLTLFDATSLIAKVAYKRGSYGIYITSINGVEERIISKSEGYSWLWFIYDNSTRKFVLGAVACDKYVIKDGDMIMWKYSHWKF